MTNVQVLSNNIPITWRADVERAACQALASIPGPWQLRLAAAAENDIYEIVAARNDGLTKKWRLADLDQKPDRIIELIRRDTVELLQQ